MSDSADNGTKKVDLSSLVEKVTWRHYCFFIVHLLQSVANAIAGPVMTQYLYAKITEEHLRNSSLAQNLTSSRAGSNAICRMHNTDSPMYHMQQSVQAETAAWRQYFALVSGVPAVVTIFLAGSWSDVIGRKTIVVVNMVGHLFRGMAYSAVMFWDLHTAYLFVGYTFDGLAGGYLTNVLMTYAYTADITPKTQTRATVLVVAQNIFHFCYGAVHFGTGYFIRASGFFWPMMASNIMSAVLVFVFIFLVPETVQRGKLSELSLVRSFKRVISFYTKRSPGVANSRIKFWLCILSFGALSQALLGRWDVEPLYQLNTPFCWDSVKIGQYNGAMSLAQPIAGIASLKIFQLCLSIELIGAVSMVAIISQSLIAGFSQISWQLYLAGIIGSAGMLSFAMIRTIVSHLSGASEQGSVFAGLGTVEAFCGMTSAVMLNSIYAATLYWMKGFVFITIAIISVIPAILLTILHVINKREEKTSDHEKTNEIIISTISDNPKDEKQ